VQLLGRPPRQPKSARRPTSGSWQGAREATGRSLCIKSGEVRTGQSKSVKAVAITALCADSEDSNADSRLEKVDA
jgi:hypothetical protein